MKFLITVPLWFMWLPIVGAAISNYLRQALINHVLRNSAYTQAATVYVALYTSDPTNADTGTEVTGGSYARQSAAFAAPSGTGATDNTGTITFPTATANWGTVTHVGIRDASTAGNLLFYGPLSSARTILNGDIAKFNIGDLDVSLS